VTDFIYVKVEGAEKWATLNYDGSKWSSSDLTIENGQSYKAVYAPNYTLNDNGTDLELKDPAASGEYLTCSGKRPISIQFTRNYSRLRIYCGTSSSSITVSFGEGFTASDGTSTTSFTLSPDTEGNAFVYGSWNVGTSLNLLSIVSGNPNTDVSYIGANLNKTISNQSETNKSYAIAAPTDTWYIYNLDKATESKTVWSDAVNAGYTKIKLIGAWNSETAPSFQKDYKNPNETGDNIYITCIDFGDVTGLTYLPDYICTFIEKLEKVILPEGLETIGNSSFCGCDNLKDINLPSTLKEIGSDALYNCYDLTSITSLPKSLKKIGNTAFGSDKIYFSSLPENIELGKNVFIGSTFCSDSFEWPETITEIPKSTFSYSSKLNLVIPSSVTTIGESAFSDCSNLTIKCLATSVPTLGNNAFKAGYMPSETYKIYVPSSSLNDYKSAWGSYSSLTISAIEE
jgi:hypothetical protein